MTERPAPRVSLVNLPNALTVLRLILVPVFLLALFAEGGHDTTWRWIAWAVFALAAITPCLITASRSRVMPISRTSTTRVIHQARSPSMESPISAEPVSALSAIGSAILPKSVTWPRLRAMCPS